MIGRRSFVTRTATAVAGLLVAPGALLRPGRLASARVAGPHAVHPSTWTWVHGGRVQRSPAEWRTRFRALRESGIKGLLVGGGDTELLSAAAHDEGLAFHRWLWTLNRPGDAELQSGHPDWYMVSREGKSCLEHPPYVPYYKWLCPTRDGARDHVRRRIEEVASDPAVDGIHLDYVRYPDVILPRGLWERYGLVQDRELPEFDFCYCAACRSAFRELTGRDPGALPDPAADADWRRFRWDRVTRLVGELTATVHAAGKPISAAVFATPDLGRRLVRQAWDEWPLDLVFPMLYHRMYDRTVSWIGDAVREGRIAMGPGTPLFAGLYLPHLSPAELDLAIDAALRGGATGVSLFESDRLSEDHLDVLNSTTSSSLQPQDA